MSLPVISEIINATGIITMIINNIKANSAPTNISGDAKQKANIRPSNDNSSIICDLGAY